MKIWKAIFSPTGGTGKTADIISKELGADVEKIDLTDAVCDFDSFGFNGNDVVIIAVPSFGGRCPDTAVSRISALHGNGAREVLVCVYGNRAYEDTLIELCDTAKGAGFSVVAAVSAIAEHSIVRTVAAGRPDDDDKITLREFASRISEKLASGCIGEPSVPGNRPYKSWGGSGMVPSANNKCTSCGICAEHCPVSAIDKADPAKTDKDRCISCMRCLEICPNGARELDEEMFLASKRRLEEICRERKLPELFM